MVDSPGRVDVLPAQGELPQDSGLAGISRRRVRVFLITFLLCLAAGLIWDFQRPALYRASASLLTVAPPEVDQASAEADVQHVAIQRQQLLSRPVLEKVAAELARKNTDSDPVSADELHTMLEVLPLAETNLVELRAEGGAPLVLSSVVNTWIDTYLKVRAEEVASLNAQTVDVLRRQYDDLGSKIEAKRTALSSFREQNQILSTARDENQVLARLKGLNDSLNTAVEEKVKARARLDAVNAALSRGEAVVPEQDKRSYAEMVKRAQELREQVAELKRRYTQDYIQRLAALRVIPEKLQKLEQKIRRSRQEGQKFVLANARQEYVAANQTVTELERQHDALKQEASEFSARFAEYEAKQEDLAGLEVLYRELEDRLVKVEISNREKYPQLQVVEWAYAPSSPVWPHYLRDAGIVAGLSLVVALLMVWLVDFLRPIQRQPGSSRMGITIYPANAALEQAAATVPSLEQDEQRALPAWEAGELGTEEVASLLEHADPVARQLIGLLMSGLSAKEIVHLEAADIDLEKGEVRIAEAPTRQIQLPSRIHNWFEREGQPWLTWKSNGHFDLEELDAHLQLAAMDAGLEADQPSYAELLRNSYLLYLVRQGVRLSELEGIAGVMPARRLVEYGRYSPAQSGRPLSEINTIYPLFA